MLEKKNPSQSPRSRKDQYLWQEMNAEITDKVEICEFAAHIEPAQRPYLRDRVK